MKEICWHKEPTGHALNSEAWTCQQAFSSVNSVILTCDDIRGQCTGTRPGLDSFLAETLSVIPQPWKAFVDDDECLIREREKTRQRSEPVAVVRLQYRASWLLKTKSGISRSSFTRMALTFWASSQKKAKSLVAKPSKHQKKGKRFNSFQMTA